MKSAIEKDTVFILFVREKIWSFWTVTTISSNFHTVTLSHQHLSRLKYIFVLFHFSTLKLCNNLDRDAKVVQGVTQSHPSLKSERRESCSIFPHEHFVLMNIYAHFTLMYIWNINVHQCRLMYYHMCIFPHEHCCIILWLISNEAAI